MDKTSVSPKTAVITVHASGNTMTLLATRKADGTAVTRSPHGTQRRSRHAA